MLTALDYAKSVDDVNLPGYDLHPLKVNLAGHWAIRVDRMWRLTFMFDGEAFVLLDYQDYH